jgi:hypothetical protein
MKVFIVIAQSFYSGNEHSVWDIEIVFATKESAVNYIKQKKQNGSDVEYAIETEEVYGNRTVLM